MSDDCIAHAPSERHLDGEVDGSKKAVDTLENGKIKRYANELHEFLRHPAVLAGKRVICFVACSFSSFGDYGKGTVKFMNAAAGLHKKLAREEEAVRGTRPDGLTPANLSARFRWGLRAKLQAAILKGDGFIATHACI